MRAPRFFTIGFVFAYFFITQALAVDPLRIPAGGNVLIDSGPDSFATVTKWPNPQLNRFERFTVEGQPFTNALRAHTLALPKNLWTVEVNWFTGAPIRKGDVLLATFAARGEGTMGRDARIEVRIDQAREPWDEIATFQTGLSHEWERFYVPCVAPKDFPKGLARISVRLGFPPQFVDLAEVKFINYGTNRAVRELPMTRHTYGGREPDAAWRKAALERIERNRKADLRVHVVDRDGKPVRDAKVHVKQTRSAFPFASAVSGEWLVKKKGAEADRYRKFVEDNFDSVTVEWETCWQPWEWDNKQALDCVQWLHERGKTIHGCHIIWPGLMWMPKDCASLTNNPDALRKRVLGHTFDKLTALRGKVVEWNAVNEPYSEHFVQDVLGRDFLVEIFKTAHGIDPAAKLGLNDFGDIASWDAKHQEAFLANIQFLLDRGAPMKVIGLQSHFGSNVRPPEDVLKLLDRFAAFGLPLHISELDINTLDESLQADYLRDVMIALFSHEAVEKITLWGFWEGRIWLPHTALFRRDWTPKPSGLVWQDLVFKQWRTDTNVTTDADGFATVRGFLGHYELTTAQENLIVKTNAALMKTSAPMELRLISVK